MKTLTLGLVMSTLMLGACAIPAMLTGGGKTAAHRTSSNTTSTTEEINGEPIEPDEPAEPAPHSKAKKKKDKVAASDFGATCTKNAQCESNSCFVGSGEIGYCTMMCSSWSECPSHWECERAGNSAQRICQQD